MDKNNNGSLEIREIGIYFSKLRLTDTLTMMKLFDTDGDKELSKDEFIKVFESDEVEESKQAIKKDQPMMPLGSAFIAHEQESKSAMVSEENDLTPKDPKEESSAFYAPAVPGGLEIVGSAKKMSTIEEKEAASII